MRRRIWEKKPRLSCTAAVAVAVVLTFVVIFFTERGLSAKWGVVLKDDPMGGGVG